MRESRCLEAKISATVLALATLAFAGCGAGKPQEPSTTSPTFPLRATTSAVPAGPATLVGEIERELSAVRATRYQHTTAVDESSGSYFYDCSGFLDYAMGRVLAADLRSIPHTKSRPRAADIEHYLHRGLTDPIDGWQALARVDALGPGDVIAWLATEDSTTGDTGHVMVVLEAPTQDSVRPAEWLVRVADSTLNPHARDSRKPGATGLGTGTIGLVADRGTPTAFYWRGGASPEAKPTEIALGRPQGT
ncbi:hypothetical protein [Mycobacterium sp. 1165178.9]|uniref:hypothetical protein n=1 Tax=Mycobacterium sp. 1165178.9 TaxID=1834070 RepID=UPI0007FB7F6B|nr:hypothetical protein [Mycobacterium sp. 1165178.9]OBK73472.1 hypothetical protein A5652_20975 [Mycobacterium sp. 1165178.9]